MLANPLYCASKAAIISMVKCLAPLKQIAGIRNAAVCPGVVRVGAASPFIFFGFLSSFWLGIFSVKRSHRYLMNEQAKNSSSRHLVVGKLYLLHPSSLTGLTDTPPPLLSQKDSLVGPVQHSIDPPYR